MVKQARTYFAGAVSGVTLIGIAIALFVILVSAQVFHDWPIAALGFGHNDSAVAPAKSLGGASAQTAAAAPTKAVTTPAPPARTAPVTTPAPTPRVVHHHHKAQRAQAEDVTRAAPVVEEVSDPAAVGDESSSGSSGAESTPASSPSSSNSSGSSSNSGSGNSSSSGSPSSGSNNTASGSSPSGGSSGGGSTGTGSPGGGSTGTAPVTETVETVAKAPANVSAGVNETVNKVDEEALGGTLKEAGVTEVTESVVNGLAGPETVVGKTVNGVGEVVGGLLGGGSH